MENKKQFCILCGAENKIQDRFCHSCGQPLEQTDDELKEYVTGKVKEKTKEKAKEKAEENDNLILNKDPEPANNILQP